MTIDINCDLGELGDNGNDEAIMPYITSANIACGAHAGDHGAMEKTIRLALKHGVSIGAHPGYPDPQNFGRIPMKMTMKELRNLVWSQVTELMGIAEALEQKVKHVKPHGALYNSASVDYDMAAVIAGAVKDADCSLMLVGPPGSQLEKAANRHGLVFVREVFADRAYNDDGTLVARNVAGSVFHDTEAVIRRAVNMVLEKQIVSITGKKIPVEADTVCIHGDNEMAPEFARCLLAAFRHAGINVKSPGKA